MTLSDQETRRRIERDVDATLLVEAAAGTGKTTCLISRMISVLGAGEDVGSLVAVTFTDKAAGELRLRLRIGLERAKASAQGETQRHLGSALAGLERARVSTVHRFALDLLRQRPLRAGLDPSFEVISAGEQRRLSQEAFGRWFEQARDQPSAALKRYFARKGSSVADLERALRSLIDHRHLGHAWTVREVDLATQMRALAERVTAVAERGAGPFDKRDKLYRALLPTLDLARRIRQGGLSGEELEAGLIELTHRVSDRVGGRAEYKHGVPRAELLAERAALLTELDAFAASASAHLATELQGELRDVVRSYGDLKRARGVVDFDDLLILSLELVERDEQVLHDLRRTLRRFFVDEFQDTDPAQASLLLLLAGEDAREVPALQQRIAPGKLFLVGDPKQSIYRFRQADPGTYLQVKNRVRASGGEILHLSTSFRSVPDIVGFVNSTFAPLMAGEPRLQQAAYVELVPNREPFDERPSLVCLPVPEPYGKQRLAKSAIAVSHPHAVAGYLHHLFAQSGRRVHDPRTGQLVPVRPDHVAILFKQFDSYGSHRPEVFSRSLSSFGVPHLVVGGRATFEREESQALISALGAIEYPDDGLLVYATLSGPLFGFADDVLFEWSVRYGGLRPFAPPITALPGTLEPVSLALSLLLRLHRQRLRRPAQDTITDLLNATRAPLGFALSSGAEQAFLELAALAQAAAEHEREGGLSFKAFVDALSEAELERAHDDAGSDEASGVRLMTVHAAKGLEFPVVVLADPGIVRAHPPNKLVDGVRGLGVVSIAGLLPWDLRDGFAIESERCKAEGVRVAYVAATRARDLLVVPAVTDLPTFPEDGWLRELSGAITPNERDVLIERGSGTDCARRPPGEDGPRHKLLPGTYRHALGAIEVVDIDLIADCHTRAQLPGSGLIDKHVDPALVEQDRAELAQFLAARAQLLAERSAPSWTVVTATARSKLELPPRTVEVSELRLARSPDRPGGKRFGTLVHELVASVELSAGGPEVGALAKAIGRLHDAPAVEVDAAVAVVRALLDSDVMRRARAAQERARLYREVPVTLRLGAHEIVDGVVDLAFEEDAVMHVFDYKTDDPDRLMAEARLAYHRQVGLYAQAITQATGLASQAALLFI